MTFLVGLLIIICVGAMIGVPVRLFQLVRGSIQAAYSRMGAFSKLIVTVGLVILVLSAFSWAGLMYVAVMVFTDDTTPRIWGGSEFGMTSSVLGFLYLIAELLLLPVTIHQLRNKRVASA